MIKTIELRTKTKIFRLDARIVAEHRAKHYSDSDFEEEVIKFALNNGLELDGWLYHNTDPSTPDQAKPAHWIDKTIVELLERVEEYHRDIENITLDNPNTLTINLEELERMKKELLKNFDKIEELRYERNNAFVSIFDQGEPFGTQSWESTGKHELSVFFSFIHREGLIEYENEILDCTVTKKGKDLLKKAKN